MSNPQEAISKIAKIDEVEKISQIDPAQVEPMGQAIPDVASTDKALFDSLMFEQNKIQELQHKKQSRGDKSLAKNDSFLDAMIQEGDKTELNQYASKDNPTKAQSLQDRNRLSLDRVRELRQKLIDPSTKVKTTYQTPLNNKLTSINNHLDVLSKSVGVSDKKNKVQLNSEFKLEDASPVEKLPKPVRKFVKLLTNAQTRFESLDNELLTINTKEFSPASMLAIQIKMGHIQHELELFTSLLNKALEGTKTLMNVQI